MLGAVTLIMAHNRRPERVNGLLFGVSTIPQAAAAYLLPVLLLPRFGPRAGFLVLAGSAVAAAVAAVGLARRVHGDPASQGGAGLRWSPGLVLFVAAVLLQNAGIGAAWNYLERLAALHGFSASVVGLATSLSLVAQVLGAFAAGAYAGRLPANAFLIGGGLVQALMVAVLIGSGEPMAFVAAAAGFGLCWLALQPFQLMAAIVIDPRRRVAVLRAPLVMLGLAIGPGAASVVVAGSGVAAGVGVASAMLVAAAALFSVSARSRRRVLLPA